MIKREGEAELGGSVGTSAGGSVCPGVICHPAADSLRATCDESGDSVQTRC